VREIYVMCVGGNHGENRGGGGGQATTSFADNDDVAVFEIVADGMALNPDAFSHIHFQIPDEDLTCTRDLQGVGLGIAHAHQARGGPQKVKDWWGRCIENGHPIAAAHILVTAHYHHLICEDRGRAYNQDYGRTWWQCPTLDGGSRWWRERGRESTVQGTLAFTVDPSHSRGWANPEVVE
jgi:hypothetical protein